MHKLKMTFNIPVTFGAMHTEVFDDIERSMYPYTLYFLMQHTQYSMYSLHQHLNIAITFVYMYGRHGYSEVLVINYLLLFN